jgi:hypothetical protein
MYVVTCFESSRVAWAEEGAAATVSVTNRSMSVRCVWRGTAKSMDVVRAGRYRFSFWRTPMGP